jgi:hypothetical protein
MIEETTAANELFSGVIEYDGRRRAEFHDHSGVTCSLKSRVNVRRLSTAVLAATAPFLVIVKPPPRRDMCLTFCVSQGCSSTPSLRWTTARRGAGALQRFGVGQEQASA